MTPRSASKVVDLLKATRGAWITRADINLEIGLSRTAARLWLEELAAQGVLVSATGPRQGRAGQRPRYYTLAPSWGGNPPPLGQQGARP